MCTDRVEFVKVERTKNRPIACGEISRLKAFVFLGLPLSAVLALLLALNWNTSVFCVVYSIFSVRLLCCFECFTYMFSLLFSFQLFLIY